MSLISYNPYNPFKEIEKIFDEWASQFNELSLPELLKIEEPRIDLYEQNDKLVAEIEMPGIDPKTIDVAIEDNLLKVEAKKEEKKEEKKKGYYKKEIRSGYLKRMIALPVEVKGEKAKASYKNGVLRVEMPKIEAKIAKEKKIKVDIK